MPLERHAPFCTSWCGRTNNFLGHDRSKTVRPGAASLEGSDKGKDSANTVDIAASLRCHSDDVHSTDVVVLNSDVNMKNLICMIYLIFICQI